MEKMLVAEALDTRDFLKKKIHDDISRCRFVEICREKDTKINGTDITKIEEDIKSLWQSIMDNIDRYDRINAAIIQSNATTTIKFKDGTEMTKAEAISRKKSDSTVLMNSLYISATQKFESVKAKDARITTDQMNQRNEFISRMTENSQQKQASPEIESSVEQFIKPYNAKWINPLDIETKLHEIDDRIKAFDSEVDTLLKVSNATTYIEF